MTKRNDTLRRRTRQISIGMGIGWLLLSTGCQSLWLLRQHTLPECPGKLVSSAEMGTAFRARYHVHVHEAEVDERFTLIAEHRGDSLVVVALNRFGAELFALRQQREEVEQVGIPLPGFRVPPLNVLRDLHRIRFLDAGTRSHAQEPGLGPAHPLEQRPSARVESCGVESQFALVEETLF